MQAIAQPKHYTPEEYLELEEKAEYKSEYRDGEIVPMTGGTTNHNKIAGNFYKNFPLTVEGQDYEVYIGDVRLWVPRYRLYTYPDVMAIEDKPIYEGKGTTTIVNPLLIVEVLSKSTQGYDKGAKFKYYRSIPSLREYITVDQYSFAVEQFYKNSEEKWVLTEYEEEEAVLQLESVRVAMSLGELYRRVEFEKDA